MELNSQDKKIMEEKLQNIYTLIIKLDKEFEDVMVAAKKGTIENVKSFRDAYNNLAVALCNDEGFSSEEAKQEFTIRSMYFVDTQIYHLSSNWDKDRASLAPGRITTYRDPNRTPVGAEDKLTEREIFNIKSSSSKAWTPLGYTLQMVHDTRIILDAYSAGQVSINEAPKLLTQVQYFQDWGAENDRPKVNNAQDLISPKDDFEMTKLSIEGKKQDFGMEL